MTSNSYAPATLNKVIALPPTLVVMKPRKAHYAMSKQLDGTGVYKQRTA